jgi:hypothetical protein
MEQRTMKRHAMLCKRLLWFVCLMCALLSILAQNPGRVRQVANASQLQAALQEGVPHIEVIEHLDLSGQQNITSADALSASSGRVTHFGNPTFRSFRVCSPALLPLASACLAIMARLSSLQNKKQASR